MAARQAGEKATAVPAEAADRGHMEIAAQTLAKGHLISASFVPGAIIPEEKLLFSISELSCNSLAIFESGGTSVAIALLCHLHSEQLCHPPISPSCGEVSK